MSCPDFMIHQSFRYVLGRMTYAVSQWCDWAVDNWDDIPEGEKNIVIRELEEAFDQDDSARDSGRPFLPLGHDCDRRQWERVRSLYKD